MVLRWQSNFLIIYETYKIFTDFFSRATTEKRTSSSRHMNIFLVSFPSVDALSFPELSIHHFFMDNSSRSQAARGLKYIYIATLKNVQNNTVKDTNNDGHWCCYFANIIVCLHDFLYTSLQVEKQDIRDCNKGTRVGKREFLPVENERWIFSFWSAFWVFAECFAFLY